MASQVVSAAKRFRISLLLDAYGSLLTDKQRNFLRLYYEEDLSFGEIAREHGVSRQAIFDSVKHGEESLEQFERALRLVDSGWVQWKANEIKAEAVVAQINGVIRSLEGGVATPDAIATLQELADQLSFDTEQVEESVDANAKEAV